MLQTIGMVAMALLDRKQNIPFKNANGTYEKVNVIILFSLKCNAVYYPICIIFVSFPQRSARILLNDHTLSSKK